MLAALIVLAVFLFGGLCFTYLFFDDERLLWRLAAGNIVSCATAGVSGFVITLFFGLSATTAGVSVLTALLPAVILLKADVRTKLARDWQRARSNFQHGNKRIGGLIFYSFFFILFCLFFSQAIYQTPDGIFTGGSQNLGDLPFHLGAIFSFTDGANFPPMNPSFSGVKFAYPFVADLLTALTIKLGGSVRAAMVVEDITWAFSLLVLLERFTVRVTLSKLAGRIAPFLLFFSGGLGFLFFARDLWQQQKGFFDFISALPSDYTITNLFRWGNSMVVLFITQRSLLLGMPLAIMAIDRLWATFSGQDGDEGHPQFVPPFVLGTLVGTLPLVHLHSLLVVFIVAAVCLLLYMRRWKEWFTFAVGVSIVAVPFLAWLTTGEASDASKFIGWNFGWDKGDKNFFYFWLLNTGLVIPLIAAGVYLAWTKGSKEEHKHLRCAALFYIPFALIFVIANVVKLAPWEWDNIKILIYWFAGSIPFIALAIVWAWEKKAVWLKAAAALVFLSLIASGALDVYRTASGQNVVKVFDADGVKIADAIKQKTAPNALILNAPTYNSAVVLSGRQSLMRYTGHLSSHGIDFEGREKDVKMIYLGGGVADILLKKYGIDYVLVSPPERNDLKANDEYFEKYPLVAESGQYRLYKVK